MSELDKKRKELFDETMLDGKVSMTWAMKNILGLSESEIKEELKKKK
jgi:hypothetical protein